MEKEIALLGVELREVEEPQALSQSVQQQLFDKSLDPLFREIVRLLTPLCEFFADNRLRLNGQFGDDNRQQNFADRGENLIVGGSVIPRPEGCWAGTYTIRDLQIHFQLMGFKKGRFETSDISRMLRIRFEPLKYNVLIPAGQSSSQHHVQHFYQESLRTDEIREIAQKFVRYFLDEIKRKAKSSFA